MTKEMTTRQAAEALETTPAYVHWLIRLGKLRAEKRLGRLAISPESVEAYLAARRARAKAQQALDATAAM